MNLTFEAVELDRAELSAAFEQIFRKSKWPANRPRRWGRGPSHWLAMIIFVGHQFGTTVIFATFLTFAWSLDFFCAWLNSVYLFSDDVLKLASRVELALVYGDAALCACFWLDSAWTLFKETRR